MLNRAAGMTARSSFKRKELPPRSPPVIKPLGRPVIYADGTAMAKSTLKGKPQKNAHLLAMAKGMPCLIRSPICNYDAETTVACHAGGVANGKGMGYKVSDALTVWGCSACNHYTDAYGGATKAEKVSAFALALIAQAEQFEALAESARAKAKDRVAAQWWLRNQPKVAEEST